MKLLDKFYCWLDYRAFMRELRKMQKEGLIEVNFKNKTLRPTSQAALGQMAKELNGMETGNAKNQAYAERNAESDKKGSCLVDP